MSRSYSWRELPPVSTLWPLFPPSLLFYLISEEEFNWEWSKPSIFGGHLHRGQGHCTEQPLAEHFLHPVPGCRKQVGLPQRGCRLWFCGKGVESPSKASGLGHVLHPNPYQGSTFIHKSTHRVAIGISSGHCFLYTSSSIRILHRVGEGELWSGNFWVLGSIWYHNNPETSPRTENNSLC